MDQSEGAALSKQTVDIGLGWFRVRAERHAQQPAGEGGQIMDQSNDCKARVCHVSTVHSGLDPRIFWKECVSLASAGYRVTLLAPGIPAGIVQGVVCIPLRHETRRWVRLFMGFPVFWRVLRLHPWIAHFHDPELIPVALALRVFGLQTIYDAHEDLLKEVGERGDKGWERGAFVRMAVRTYASLLERCLKWLSAVVYVVDGQTEARMNARAVLVRNFAREDLFAGQALPHDSGDRPETIVLVGGLTRLRGIREVIDGVGMLPEGRADLILAGRWESAAFREECEQSPGWPGVQYLGGLAHTAIPEVLRQADIGIHCPHREDNMDRSIPVKVFEYLASGLPLVLTDVPYWHELLGNLPVYVAELTAPLIAAALSVLINDAPARKERARAGLRLLETKGWYWEKEAVKLLALYDDLGSIHV